MTNLLLFNSELTVKLYFDWIITNIESQSEVLFSKFSNCSLQLCPSWLMNCRLIRGHLPVTVSHTSHPQHSSLVTVLKSFHCDYDRCMFFLGLSHSFVFTFFSLHFNLPLNIFLIICVMEEKYLLFFLLAASRINNKNMKEEMEKKGTPCSVNILKSSSLFIILINGH